MPREPWKISREMFLSEDETQTLRDHLRHREEATDGDDQIAALTDRVIVETLLFSGLRNSEFCQLCVGDVSSDRKSSTITVRETPRQNRIVHVPRTLVELIRRYLRETRASVSSREAQQPLILNERGKPYERTALYRRVVRILTDAGLAERASVQLLRHTYGYLAYKRTGGNLLFVQRQLGHAHPMVTAVYAEFAPFDGDELADRIAGDLSTNVRPKPFSRRTKR